MKIRSAILICVIVFISSIFVLDKKLTYADTGIKAFLNANFGMSIREVEKGINNKLLEYEKYVELTKTPIIKKTNNPSPSPDSNFEGRLKTLYMPEIVLFDSQAAAGFEFLDGKLSAVAVHFRPYAGEDSQKTVSEITDNFEKTYKFVKLENSKGLPGAYTIKYKKYLIEADIWIYLADPAKKRIIVFIRYLPYTKEHYTELKQSSESVF